VRIIDDLEVKAGEARVGAKVTLEDQQTKERMTYVLVGAEEADPTNGKLSLMSPLGRSVLGKKAGDTFTLTLPKAVVPYKVVRVERG
jgi:transcription elongation factor GreA